MANGTPRYVFVYGTLRCGDVRDINLLKPAPHFVGYAVIQGSLYHLGSYPGIVLGGQGVVKGEVYEVQPALERLLDEIEEVWPQQTGEYVKRELVIPVDIGSGAAPPGLTCVLYEISPDRLIGKLLIAGGDWRLHQQQ